jgi:hypothetical protein
MQGGKSGAFDLPLDAVAPAVPPVSAGNLQAGDLPLRFALEPEPVRIANYIP